jgi:threonylcarbamoyladenosine tRNA methylthiotransferase MtaB
MITLGCKVNQYESASFNEAFSEAGLEQVKGDDICDLVVVNTCIVTLRAAHQSRQAIRKAIRENPGAYIAAVGCYAQAFPGEIQAIDGVNLVVDNRSKSELIDAVLNAENPSEQVLSLKTFEENAPFDFLEINRFPGRARAYLKIQDGCQSFCSYCIVPMTRGPYRSLPPENVLSALRALSENGHKEVVLTGIHLGKYGFDLPGRQSLVALLRVIERERFPLRIRLSSLEPNEIEMELIEMVASRDWLCRHFHIPLQSGDDGVLKRMNRTYPSVVFKKVVNTLYELIPDVAIGVDVMTGFPGEDPIAHRNSYSLIQDLPVSYLHVFPFSPRPGTRAWDFKGRIDPATLKERAAELRVLGLEKRRRFYHDCLEKCYPVLVEGVDSSREGFMKGTSDNYLPVVFPGDMSSKGEIVRVRMEGVEENVVVGSCEESKLRKSEG